MPIIDQARPDEWPAAFALAYQRTPAAARQLQVAHALDLLATGVLHPAGIWIARDGQSLRGVQICVPLGGASYLFWLPEARGPREIADAVTRAGLAWCAAEGGKLAQALAPPTEADRAAPLVRQGFRQVTQLLYLERDLRDLTRSGAAPAIRCEPCTAANEACFRETLARSYEGTLDCPELNGVRSVDEILAGYRAASAGGPQRWWLIRAGSDPAGVLIVTDLPEGPAWDLSYLGVLPEYRRRGVATSAGRIAMQKAQAAGATQMVLAVDERNAPARQLYEALGFAETEARMVYLHFLPGPGRRQARKPKKP